MRAGWLLLLLLASGPAEPSLAFFSDVREVHVGQPDRQNFFVVDPEIWNHSRSDLGDLRLMDGESAVQYAISEQNAGVSSEEAEAKILNLGLVKGHTEFDIDAQALQTYDRIHLRLDAKDFVVSASLAGSNTLGQPPFVEMAPSTLYDFSSEQLGSNFVLKLPAASFRYLHVTLGTGILPQQVKGAAIYDLHEQRASWTKVGSCGAPQPKERATVIGCNVSPKIPLNRIVFQVAPGQVNFRRTVSVEDAKGLQQASGEISRVRINRAGTLVTAEELGISVSSVGGPFTLSIDNGDNPPLTILQVEPQEIERRIYFDPQGKASLRLYYGDDKLSAPVYDYARFFHVEGSPVQAELGAGSHNPIYAGRPDDRPWSERHGAVLWAAMILAVAGLAVLVVRGLRTMTS